jgi:hypothetical protein
MLIPGDGRVLLVTSSSLQPSGRGLHTSEISSIAVVLMVASTRMEVDKKEDQFSWT